MYRFALRPAWIVSHLFVLGLIVLFVNLGFWQLSRYDERIERNEAVTARSEQPPVPVGELVDETDQLDDLRYRPVTATGTFVEGADLLIDNRSNEGLPGAWVVSPLRLDGGGVVAVGRGFLRFEDGELDAPPVPAGPVSIGGYVTTWSGPCGTRVDDAGAVVGAACLDRQAAVAVAGVELLPVVVQQQASSADSPALSPVPLPELGEGSHRSYAVQWFIFATIGAVGYPLILRKVARDRANDAVDPPEAAVVS